MSLKSLFYDHTCYLRNNGFVVSICDYNSGNFFIHKKSIDYFAWNEVSNDLEPLLFILYKIGLLDYITINNVARRHIKFTFPVKDHISSNLNLDSIFSNISNYVL